jgi:hypothetical protein
METAEVCEKRRDFIRCHFTASAAQLLRGRLIPRPQIDFETLGSEETLSADFADQRRYKLINLQGPKPAARGEWT